MGSVIFISGEDGAVVPGSWTHYLPFGGYENGSPTADITDLGYTGHRHNDDLGLIYMNARYYDPGMGRFVSADGLVPDLANPQSFNRYSYVRNNPTNFTDPTGHRACGKDCDNPLPYIERDPFTSPFINFIGLDWEWETKVMIHLAAKRIADRMAKEVNASRSESEAMSAEEVFLGVFGGPITFYRTSRPCTAGEDCLAWMPSDRDRQININRMTNPYHAVHEIFHIFDIKVLGGAANQAVWDIQQQTADTANPFPNRPDLKESSTKRWGFAGGNFSEWQKSRSGTSGEEFADMGIGWTYGRWETLPRGGWSDDGRARADFMDVNMAIWLNQLIH